MGPRLINDEVMSSTKWDTALEVGLSASNACKSGNCYYGLAFFGNNAWDARVNSVNGAGAGTPTTFVHNSASMDFMVFAGKDWKNKWFSEIGVGPQVSWIKWPSSILAVESGVRVSPKVRLALSRKISEKSKLYLAFNQSFNIDGTMKCPPRTAACVDNEGFANVSDLKLGFSTTL